MLGKVAEWKQMKTRACPGFFLYIFILFKIQLQINKKFQLRKRKQRMLLLEFEPRAAW